MDKLFLYTVLILVSWLQCSEGGILTQLIQNNLSGKPVIHVTQEWKFDPEVGKRRRTEFEAVNGHLGERLIERLGLGEDGLTEERRQQQRYRDSIGALSYQVPS